MKALYGIAAAGERVRLDGRRRGEVRFTIANQAGLPLLTRLRVVALDGAGDGWFAPLEIAERVLEVDGSQLVVVAVSVPDDAPAGTFGLRLDLIGVDNPDEYYTAGPRVQVLVPARAMGPQALPAWPWFVAAALLAAAGGLLGAIHHLLWLAILLPLAAVALVVGFVLLRSRPQAVPAAPSPQSPAQPPVQRQADATPAPPAPKVPNAAPQTAMRVPRLIGLSLDEATAALAALGARVGTVGEEASAAKPGTVLDQRPAGQQLLAPGQHVELVVAALPSTDAADKGREP